MGGRHGAALFCVANCDFGFAANCAGAANCALRVTTISSRVKRGSPLLIPLLGVLGGYQYRFYLLLYL